MMNIFVLKVGDKDAIRVTSDTLKSIPGYFWKGNRIVYLQDIGGDENFQLFSVTATGEDLKALTPFPGCRSIPLDRLRFIPGKEKEILIQLNKRDKQYFDPYMLNIETGDLKLMYENRQNFDSWYTDNDGVIRLATKTDGVNITYLYRKSEKDDFSELLTTSFKDTFTPQAFDAQNKNIYVTSNFGRDKIALVEYDPSTKEELKELHSNPDYDLSYAFYDKKKKVLAGAYWEGIKTEIHFFDKEWGKKMQDDITDGVEFLKKEGIADPERIAIYGGSYGGYATLAGVAFTPDLYACAVDYVGVSNLFTFLKTIPPYWKPYLDQLYEMVGDPVKDSVLFAEASPVLHADKIQVPLFIAQGANDPRVNKAESDQVVAALKDRGVEVEYMVKDNEGHGFRNQDNRFDFYGAMEKFLEKHLKAK